MSNSVFTTLLSHTATNDYGNTITTSFIHRSAGVSASDSAGVEVPEAYLIRVEQKGMNTFHGRIYSAEHKIEALEDYNRRVGTYVSI